MKNAMFVGLALGIVTGVCIASNSKKARTMVTDAQDQIKSKFCSQQNKEQCQDDCNCGPCAY